VPTPPHGTHRPITDADLALAAELGQQLRVDSVRSSTSAGSGHPTSSMSAADLMAVLVGRHLQVNPLLIFLGLWFGGLYWGVAGVILATPTLVALKVISERAKSGKPMMEFLGPNDQAPERDDKLHQLVSKLES